MQLRRTPDDRVRRRLPCSFSRVHDRHMPVRWYRPARVLYPESATESGKDLRLLLCELVSCDDTTVTEVRELRELVRRRVRGAPVG